MTDPGGWPSAQETDFSFQGNDNFNLNEVAGIDGEFCLSQFRFSYDYFIIIFQLISLIINVRVLSFFFYII